jgi:mono/diheme cytochrome c family protein
MRASIVVAILAIVSVTQTAAGAAEPERGRELYLQKCGECHSESVHARVKRSATDYAQIRAWVQRWSGVLSLGWDRDEIEDVTAYLNATYYRFAAPAATTAAPPPLQVVRARW